MTHLAVQNSLENKMPPPQSQERESRLGFQGKVAQQDEDGNYYILAPGGVDSEGNTYNSPQYINKSQLEPVYGKMALNHSIGDFGYNFNNCITI